MTFRRLAEVERDRWFDHLYAAIWAYAHDLGSLTADQLHYALGPDYGPYRDVSYGEPRTGYTEMSVGSDYELSAHEKPQDVFPVDWTRREGLAAFLEPHLTKLGLSDRLIIEQRWLEVVPTYAELSKTKWESASRQLHGRAIERLVGIIAESHPDFVPLPTRGAVKPRNRVEERRLALELLQNAGLL